MLASWNDSPATRAIIAFVQRVTGAGPGFVPAAERIAAFDNDGTLWVERPMPPQFDFLLQMDGRAEPVAAGDASAHAFETYMSRFPFARDLMANRTGAAEKPLNVVAYVFRPERIRYIDNALGFGARVSLRLENGEAIGTPEYEDDQD